MAKNITQVFEEASIDAQALEKFVNATAEEMVVRRLAEPIRPLSHYKQYMDSLSQGKDATITSVTAKSGAAGTEASVSVGGTPNARTFEFTIPKGENAENIYQIRRSYQTYELMVADKANIPANTSIDVTNDEDFSENGTYTYDGTSFTKSIHDTQEVLKKAVEDIKQDASDTIGQAVQDYGYVTIDSFELGATITQRNQALRHAADGKLYRWTGDLPKVVPASSTPANSGGISVNAWLEVSDTTLRQDIVSGNLITDNSVTILPPTELSAIARTQRSKNGETISVLDFCTLEERQDLLLDTPVLDHTNAIKKFISAINHKKYDKATMAGSFNISETIEFTTGKTKTLYFDADVSVLGSGDTAIIFNRVVSQTYTGRLYLDTGKTIYAGRTWNNGFKFLGCKSSSFKVEMFALGFKNWGMDIIGGYGDVLNSNSAVFGDIKSSYCGAGVASRGIEFTREDTSTETILTYTANIHSTHQNQLASLEVTFSDGSISAIPVKNHDTVNKKIVLPLQSKVFKSNRGLMYASVINRKILNVEQIAGGTSQRSIITFSTPLSIIDTYFKSSGMAMVDGKPYKVMEYTPTSLTLYPNLPDTLQTDLVHVFEGGGVRIIGADANLITFNKISTTGNSIGQHFSAFYSTTVQSIGAEFNGIATVIGSSPVGSSQGNLLNNVYYEGNLVDYIATSVVDYAHDVRLSLPINFNKMYQLAPLGNSLYGKTSTRYSDVFGIYKQTNNSGAGTSPKTTKAYIGENNHYSILVDSPIIELYDSPTIRKLFGYVDINFSIYGVRGNNSMLAGITIKCEDGYTLNGQTSPLVIENVSGATTLSAHLYNGKDWRISYAITPREVQRTFNFSTIPAKGFSSSDANVTNVEIGNHVQALSPAFLDGVILNGVVSESGVVRVYAQNTTNEEINLGSIPINLTI